MFPADPNMSTRTPNPAVDLYDQSSPPDGRLDYTEGLPPFTHSDTRRPRRNLWRGQRSDRPAPDEAKEPPHGEPSGQLAPSPDRASLFASVERRARRPLRARSANRKLFSGVYAR
jgi:hypothetical protein